MHFSFKMEPTSRNSSIGAIIGIFSHLVGLELETICAIMLPDYAMHLRTCTYPWPNNMSNRRFKSRNHPNATLIKRLLAMMYDSLLVVAVWMLVSYIFIALNGGEAVSGPLFNSTLFLVTFLFFAFFWTRSGQTLGMLAWRLRVESDQGQPLNAKQALLRFMGAIFSALVLGMGYWWVLFDSNKLTWHDHWSNSRVVQLPKN